MLPHTYEGQDCSIARTLEVVGERWSLLILREAVLGARRFEEFQSALGIARNVLSSRLERLCDEGILERRRYQDRPPRHEYLPTEAGRELFPTLLVLMRWGDRHRAPDGPPTVVTHQPYGHDLRPLVVCEECGEPVRTEDLAYHPGPGRRVAAG